LLPTLQFQQRHQDTVGLVQDALLSREEDKRRNGFKTSQGIYAIGKAVLIAGLLERPIHMDGDGVISNDAEPISHPLVAIPTTP
jgi:hypothetical protein